MGFPHFSHIDQLLDVAFPNLVSMVLGEDIELNSLSFYRFLFLEAGRRAHFKLHVELLTLLLSNSNLLKRSFEPFFEFLLVFVEFLGIWVHCLNYKRLTMT